MVAVHGPSLLDINRLPNDGIGLSLNMPYLSRNSAQP